MNYTPNQRKAIETRNAHICVDAGAGSGKTRVLVDRINALLDEDPKLSLQQIVAITFTRKAAFEMKERLRSAFQERAKDGAPEQRLFWRARERQLDSARINTIDSFCTTVIREHSAMLGLDPEFRMMDEPEAQKLRIESVARILEPLLDEREPCAVLPAITYGVSSLTSQLVNLLESSHCQRMLDHHDFGSVDDLSAEWKITTEAAMDSLYKRIPFSPRLFKLARQLELLGGICAEDDDGREQSRVEYLRCIESMRTADDSLKIIDLLETMASFKPSKNGQSKNWGPEEFEKIKKATEAAKKFAKSQLVDTDPADTKTLELTRHVYTLLRKASEEYETTKRDGALMDFGDLLRICVSAFQNHPSILEDLKASIQYLFVDEFQDTNDTQLEMVKHLVDLTKNETTELFVVGDAKQSIYNFRGAEVDVFHRVREETNVPIPLDDNFRSVPEVMNFVNHFFRESRLLYGVEPDYRGLVANRPATGETRTMFLIPDDIENGNADAYRDGQARILVEQLQEMCGGAQPVTVGSGEHRRPAGFGDVTILFRTKNFMSFYEKMLLDHGIPARILEGTGFYQQQEVADLRNLIKALLDPWDSQAMLGYLRSPLAGLDDDTIFKLSKTPGLSHHFLSDLDTGHQMETLTRVRNQFMQWQSLCDGTVTALFQSIIKDTGIEAVLIGQPHGLQKASNLHKVVELAHQYDTGASEGLWGFIDTLDDSMQREVREGEAGLLEEQDGAVKLMTIHASKGLEFPIVVLAETAAGHAGGSKNTIRHHRKLGLACSYHVPTKKKDELYHSSYGELIKRIIQREDEDELARQLYVALTRAEDWLLIMGSPPPRRGTGWTNSWMDYFDQQFDLRNRVHLEQFGGDEWKASVVRNVSSSGTVSGALKEETTDAPDPTQIMKQIVPYEVDSHAAEVSVSEWLDSQQSNEGESHQGLTYSSMKAMERGTVLHQYFEAWNFASAPPSAQEWLQSFSPMHSSDRSFADALTVAATYLNESPLFCNLEDRAGAMKEVPFQFSLGRQTIRGTIDVILSDGTILDYKTGSGDGQLERYAKQLRLYAHAARTLGVPVKNQAYLFFVDVPKLSAVDVSDEMCTTEFSGTITL